jgi:ribonuclease D
MFGFDTEFIGEDSYHPHLCLIQVATAERLYLIDPLGLDNLDAFWELMADPDRVTVVHAGREEIRMCQLHLGKPPGNVFDIQVAAGLVGAGYPAGHATLVQHFLKVRLSKGETLTDWSRRPLTRQQIRYAYDDVRFLLPLYERLRAKLEQLGRLEWAGEELAHLCRRSLADDAERQPWRKLRGLGSLDRRRLAVVREVFAWRDERAAKINRPARIVLRDDLVVEIARRMPETEHDIAVMRGVGKNDPAALLAAVERGKALPAAQLPEVVDRECDPPQVAQVSAVLGAVLASFCHHQRLTPALVATTSDIKGLVRARMAGPELPADSALVRGWRAHHVLPVLLDVLDGRRAVRVGGLDSATPLELAE